MPIRVATHLFRNRHGIFYFRLVAPADLRSYLGQREFRFSLGTERRQEAIIASLPLIADLPRLLADLRLMADDIDKYPKEAADGYMRLWAAERIKNTRLQAANEQLEIELDELRARLAKSVPRDNAERVVKSAYDKGQLRGRRELEARLGFPWPPENTVPYSTLKAAYLKSLTVRADGGRKKPPTAKTYEDYDRSLQLFITVMGDIKIGEIDRAIAGAYFSTLRKLPANISRVSKYKGKTIAELVAMNDPPQSESNCSKKIERISTMFKWSLEEKRKWGIDANPFVGFGQDDSEEGKRRPFTPDELRAILNHPQYVNRQFASNYAFWLIPLATFTGARLGELAQLDLKDFVEIDGVPCIDINDIDAKEVTDEGGRKKRVKTKNAKRLVPIHPALVKMGLLRHIERLRRAGEYHLFPELSRSRRDGPAHAASNWFGTYRAKVGITVKQEAVFHSFRHLFITNILDNGIAPHLLAPIVGHEAALITGQVYWNKKDARKRLPSVEAFALPDEIGQLFPAIEDVTFAPERRSRSRRNRPTSSAQEQTDRI